MTARRNALRLIADARLIYSLQTPTRLQPPPKDIHNAKVMNLNSRIFDRIRVKREP